MDKRKQLEANFRILKERKSYTQQKRREIENICRSSLVHGKKRLPVATFAENIRQLQEHTQEV